MKTDVRILVQDWISKESPDWLCFDRSFWKSVLIRADQEAKLPDEVHWWRREVSDFMEVCRVPSDAEDWFQGFTSASDWVRAIRFLKRGVASGMFPRHPSDDLIDRYGFLIGSCLQSLVDEMTSNLSCVDNIRVARINDRAEMSWYRWRLKLGCCGFVDKEVRVLFRKYMIGCNYGH